MQVCVGVWGSLSRCIPDLSPVTVYEFPDQRCTHVLQGIVSELTGSIIMQLCSSP